MFIFTNLNIVKRRNSIQFEHVKFHMTYTFITFIKTALFCFINNFYLCSSPQNKQPITFEVMYTLQIFDSRVKHIIQNINYLLLFYLCYFNDLFRRRHSWTMYVQWINCQDSFTVVRCYSFAIVGDFTWNNCIVEL